MDLEQLVKETVGKAFNSQASNVEAAPAIAPADPKHKTVCQFGLLPGRLTTINGSSSPVNSPIVAEALYFAFWYTEKERVLTAVMLTRGAATPANSK